MSQELMSVEGQLVGMPLAGPESFSQQQLDYLKRALGVDETVLWDGGTAGTSGDITLSESVANFEKIAIFFNIAKSFEEGTYLYAGNWQHFRGDDLTAVKKFCVSGNTNNGNSDNTLVFKNQSYSVSSDGKTLTYLRTTQVYFNGSSWSVATTNKFYIYKVVGIHRIAGGN